MAKTKRYIVEYHFDVWGNPRAGFEVNESRQLHLDLDLSTNRSILRSLRETFKIKPGSVRVIDHADWIDIQARNGRPFLSIYIGE